MRRFRVWAPRAHRVDLATGSGTDTDKVPMERSADGWWSVEIDCGDDDVDYGFAIDGGPVRPDPRSRRQPRGVHGPSRTFDPARHVWGDGSWTGRQLAGAVIYELHIGTFTQGGTLDAASEKLDHLVDLGVDFVELLPAGAFNGPRGWGYDGVLWFAVHEPYGGPAAYQRFVDACHARGLGVIQDVVYNHLGPSGNYLPEFGPYLRDDAANTWGAAVNLDGPGSDEVRRYILDNAHMWFADYHVDGLRLDAVHALRDTRAVPILEELAIETDALSAHLGRPLSLIAESDLNDPALFTAREAGGSGLTAAWNDDVHHAVHVAVTDETSGYYADFAPLAALAKVLTGGFFHDGSYSSFRGRHHGRPIRTDVTPAWRLVASIQNHDQIGNRATGDRLAAQADAAAQAIAAVLLLTSPFTPMLFMGEEWGASTPWQFFTSHPEADLGERTRQGRLAEFDRHDWNLAAVPDPQDPATFERSRLDWAELGAPDHVAMWELYRRLIALRRTRPELADPRLRRARVEIDEADRWIVVDRAGLVIVANLADEPRTVPLPRSGSSGGREVLLATTPGVHIDNAGPAVTMPARCAAVVGEVQ